MRRNISFTPATHIRVLSKSNHGISGGGASTQSKALLRLERKMTTENLWLYIVSILKDNPTYAYNIRVRIAEKYGFKPPTMTVYTVLYRLIREGLIEPVDYNGMKVYRVTEKGLAIYEQAVKYLQEVVNKLQSKEKTTPNKDE